jgi:hypothetical protein
MNTKTWLHIFYNGAELLETEEQDCICIGTMLPIYSPNGVEKVMEYHTKLIDAILELPISRLDAVVFLAMRGATYHEFIHIIHDTTIKAKDFGQYPPLRCLFLSSDKERRERILYPFTKDWDGYQRFLSQTLQINANLSQFLFHEG